MAVLSTIPTEFFKVLLMLSMSGYDILFQVITSDFRWRIDDSNSNWHDTLDSVDGFGRLNGFDKIIIDIIGNEISNYFEIK